MSSGRKTTPSTSRQSCSCQPQERTSSRIPQPSTSGVSQRSGYGGQQNVNSGISRGAISKPARVAGAKTNARSGGVPCAIPRGSQRSAYSTKKRSTVPIIMTPKGPVPATHQLLLERTVNRLPDREIISKRMTGIETDPCGNAHEIEINIQDIEPGGLNESMRGESEMPIHEIISVKSSITVGHGIRSKVNKTIYESTRSSESEKDKMNPGEVLAMIEEENKEVEKMTSLQPPDIKGSATEVYSLKKKLQKMKLDPRSVRQLQSSVMNPPPNSDEPQDELQPEVMAAIMHTEERGLTMDSPPANVYNYLFPDARDDLFVEISSAATEPLQNVVVPVAVSSQIHVAGTTPEMQRLAEETTCTQPADDMYTKTVLKADAKPKINNTAVKDARCKNACSGLTDEEPPWEDLCPMINLVGAPPSNSMEAAQLSDPQDNLTYRNELENIFEYLIIPRQPRHVSKIQLRGSQKPSWFPGYYVALPEIIKIARSPSEVLPTAWQAVQPDIFTEDSFVIMS